MAVRNIGSLLAGLTLLLHTWGAWAIEISMEDRVEVRTGASANITCMFSSDEGIGGIVIHWFYSEFKRSPSSEKKEIYAQQGTVREVRRGTLFTDRISVTGPGPRGDVVLTINNVRVQDELEFICVVKDLEGGVAEGHTQLRVFDSPDDPTIEGVSVGFSVNEINPVKIGVCEVNNGYPKPNITWYRNNMPLRNSDDVRVIPTVTVESSGLMSVKSELHKKVVMEDKDARFYCEVSYFAPGMVKMVETKSIGVNVLYPSTAVELWVQSPKGKIQEGDTVELRCKGNGNSPASISIGRKDTDLVDTDEFVLENVTRQDSGDYQCTSMDIETIEEVSGHIRVDVHYLDPAVVIPDDIIVADGEEVEATCNASSSLRTTTAWFKNGDMVSQGHTLIRTEDTAGTYTCVVTVPEIEGMETSATLRVRVKGPPRITNDADTEIEESFGNTVELRCTVRGFPPLSLTWSTADGKVIEEATQTDTDDGIESLANIKVDADVTVLCKASNEYGSDARTFSIKATKHTTSPANAPTSTSTTTTSTTTTTTNTTTTTMSSATVKAETAVPPKKIKKEGSGVVIAVIIICILLLAILGSVLYFLYKTGKICGRAGKQDLTKGQSNKDNIVVEMKSDNTEEAILLGVNGEKQPPSDQAHTC